MSPAEPAAYWLLPAAAAGTAVVLHDRDRGVTSGSDESDDEDDAWDAAHEVPAASAFAPSYDDAGLLDAGLVDGLGGYGGGGSWAGGSDFGSHGGGGAWADDFGGFGGGGDWDDDDW